METQTTHKEIQQNNALLYVFFGLGDMEDCQLSVRKTFGTKSKEFVEGKRLGFEQYLQVRANHCRTIDSM